MSSDGNERCNWTAPEFQQAVNQYMQRPWRPAMAAGGAGLTVEFPYGNFSSLCQFQGDQGHLLQVTAALFHPALFGLGFALLPRLSLFYELWANSLGERSAKLFVVLPFGEYGLSLHFLVRD
jgi:hypothetical protein